jgi:hypothetical protein
MADKDGGERLSMWHRSGIDGRRYRSRLSHRYQRETGSRRIQLPARSMVHQVAVGRLLEMSRSCAMPASQHSRSGFLRAAAAVSPVGLVWLSDDKCDVGVCSSMLGTLALAAFLHTHLLQVGHPRACRPTPGWAPWALVFQVHDGRYWCMHQVERCASQWCVPVPGRLQPRRGAVKLRGR